MERRQPLDLLMGKQHLLPVLVALAATAWLVGLSWCMPAQLGDVGVGLAQVQSSALSQRLSCLISRRSDQYPVTELLLLK